MKADCYYDVGPALLVPGYRVALMAGQYCRGQALFETANDVAAAASLASLAVLTSDSAVAAACRALRVAVGLPPPVRQESMAI